MAIAPTIPKDEITERAVIAAFLTRAKLLDEYWPLLAGGEAFYHEGYRMLALAIRSLYEADLPVRLGSVIKHFKQTGKLDTFTATNTNIDGLDRGYSILECGQDCLHLRELMIKRNIIFSLQGILSQAFAGGRDTKDLIRELNQAADAVSAGMLASQEKTLKEYVSQAISFIEAGMQKADGVTGVPTGLEKLDRHLGGWHGVTMIAGRPGMGKTIVGLFAAISAARAGVPVGYISLEVDASELLIRAFSESTGIPYSNIIKAPKQLSTEQFANIQRVAGQIEQLPIHFYDDEARDIEDIRSVIIDWRRRHKVGLVVIDYVQLIEDRTQRGEYETLSEVTKKLKKLQRRVKIPLIELAQLSRDVEKRTNKRPNQSDLRSSGQLEQDASTVILLYRDDYYKLQREKETGTLEDMDYSLELICDKNRNGETGTAYIYIDVATNQLVDHRWQLDKLRDAWNLAPLEKAGF